MADLAYDYGLDEWREWETATFTWLALKSSYTPTRTHRYVSEVVVHEVDATGYSRQTPASRTRTVDTIGHRVVYGCSDPDFGFLAVGNTVGYVAIARVATNDADSIMMSLYDITEFATDGGLFSPVVGANGVHVISQA